MNTTNERWHIPGTHSMAKTITPSQMVINTFHTLQAYAILWSVTLTIMLVDDAAMLALAFC